MIATLIEILALALFGTRSMPWRTSIGASYFAHSIATPVTTLKLSLEKNTSNGPSMQAVQHIERLIQDLVHPQRETFSVTTTIREIILLLGNQGVRLVNVTDKTCTQKDQIYGYRCRFQEVVVCLISNALQSYGYQQEASVLVTVRVQIKCVAIYIVDFGQGMSTIQALVAQLPRMTFRKEGGGLGLSFTKEIIESEYAGTLQVASMIGVGTTVQIKIPITK